MLISIIVPVYNEEFHLEEALERIIKAPLPKGLEKEIIVVNDGSVDKSGEIIKKFADKKLISTYDLVLNCGKGMAIRTGLLKVHGEIVIIQDGDLEYDPNDYSALIQPILDNKYDVVYGSRFIGLIKQMKFLNRMGSTALNILTNILYNSNLTDQFTAYKVFRTKIVKSLDLKCKGFEFCSEVTNKLLKQGIKIGEVPIHYIGRSFKEGKKGGTWKDFFVALLYLLRYRFFIK